jgi:Holliday junction resolvase
MRLLCNSVIASMINSREKGCRGEREFADFLRTHGIEARRGQQFAGGGDSPDVRSNLKGVHLEIKRVEAGNIYKWLEQAEGDAGDKIPIVAHRRNDQDWIIILRADDFLNYFTKDFRSDKEP